MKWLIILQGSKFQQQESSQVKRRMVMKKSIGAISLALILVTVLLSGCVSTSTPAQPTITPSPVPSTFTPEPTATQIPSPTAVIPVWTETINHDTPFENEFKSNPYWDQGLIADTAISFSTDTRWNFDIEVDNLGKDATGIFLNGYTGEEEGETILGQKILGLYYHSGSWHLGYAINNTYIYSWDFNNLTSPKQSFSLTISKDGRKILIKNNAEFSQEIKYQEKLFDGVEAITAGYLVSPKTKFTLSSLVIEQLVDPSLLSLTMTSLKEPYTTSFENLDISNPTEMLPFRFPNTLDWASFSTRDRHRSTLVRNGNYILWTVDSRAHTGKYAINVVPSGNPVTKGMLPVSVAVLDPMFDVSGYDTVNLKMWINTTTNPRVARVHNCDSGLMIYYKTDLSASWVDKTFMCGENIKETQGWYEISLDFDVKSKSTIQFAFAYEVQNITKPDLTVYYLIDDVAITAK